MSPITKVKEAKMWKRKRKEIQVAPESELSEAPKSPQTWKLTCYRKPCLVWSPGTVNIEKL